MRSFNAAILAMLASGTRAVPASYTALRPRDTSFTFSNSASQSLRIVVWDQSMSFVSTQPPYATVNLDPGQSQSISVALTSGGFAAFYGDQTGYNSAGQVDNTWGEFTTGQYALFDVSREINMRGNGMIITGDNGCVAQWADGVNRCDFVCIDPNANSCGDRGSYDLVNCDAGSQPGAQSGSDFGDPVGGCGGWTSLSAVFRD